LEKFTGYFGLSRLTHGYFVVASSFLCWLLT